MKKLIKKHFQEHRVVLDSINNLDDSIEKAADLLIQCLKNHGTIFWCGNGGSASDSQHLAGELVGRFVKERRPLKSIALTADSAVMTCIVNDYGYDYIFSRQVEALGAEGDLLVGISTSGNSKNVLNAIEVANHKKMITVGLLGKEGGVAANIVEHSIIVDSKSTARVQEMHILIGHILCDLIEEGLDLKE
ncbi:MAG: D-sedoheptulose 7-phosphate isomerase [Methylophilaceae bacterium]|jgi:D-sedoheptulose 7-phosphate isomerase|nr:D-sedoheptulose 7-phosphate isomerase [Methylophilaceae bacterium]